MLLFSLLYFGNLHPVVPAVSSFCASISWSNIRLTIVLILSALPYCIPLNFNSSQISGICARLSNKYITSPFIWVVASISVCFWMEFEDLKGLLKKICNYFLTISSFFINMCWLMVDTSALSILFFASLFIHDSNTSLLTTIFELLKNNILSHGHDKYVWYVFQLALFS